jgi:D-glycero-D-manno-heptose 1,7-bisphosphate phosphatase
MNESGETADGMAAQDTSPTLRPALFLDRDGVLIEEVGYLADPDQVKLIPRAGAAIARLNRAGVPVVLVTNQAGIARGYLTEARLAEIHRRLSALLTAEAAKIDAIYYCPHHPTEGNAPYRLACSCRKPQSGMLLQAAADLAIDLHQSCLIGDKLSDLEAGTRAGCRSILVRTGYGRELSSQLHRLGEPLVLVADSLAEAVDYCLAHFHRSRPGWGGPKGDF